MARFQIGRRRTGINYEYDGDGRFAKERWSSSDKKYWKRWLRRIFAKDLKQRIEDK